MAMPKMPISGHKNRPHLAILPSAGMGHLTPFCHLAALLADRGCDVSFITPQPMVSNAESQHISRLLTSFPNIQSLHIPIVELDPSEFPSTSDPFFLRFEAILRSAHLLSPLLTAIPSPVSALVIDIVSASAFVPIANDLNIPSYVLYTSSASMLSLCAYFPTYIASGDSNVVGDIGIPGLPTVRNQFVPPPLRDPDHLFRIQFVKNGEMLVKADGILINTFESFESEAISALNGGHVVRNLPPVFAIGPFCSMKSQKISPITWLDQQPDKSVVYISFGSRTAMTREQIKELGAGLERSGQRFLWVLKTKKVDKEEETINLEELLGEGYIERVKERGMVINGWVAQEEILSHGAVGGFMSHCGWNSVMEAALAGVRVLAWPRIGDQRLNAGVVRRSGLGVWTEEWSWEGEGEVVTGVEIAEKVKEMMEDEELRLSAGLVAAEAKKAIGVGGSSGKGLEKFITSLMTM